jgi:hypothetical protein
MNAQNLSELQTKAYSYLQMKADVRKMWRTCIILGVIAIILGYFSIQILSQINFIAIIIGLLLIIAGIRARITVKMTSLLFSGVALSALGAWWIIVLIWNLYDAFTSNSFLGGGLGISLIWLLLYLSSIKQSLGIWRYYRSNSFTKHTDQNLQEVENIIRPIVNANVNLEHDTIGFTMNRYDSPYKAKLSRTSVIIVSKDRCDISFVRPDEFDIADQGQLNNNHKIKVQIKDATYTGMISPLSLQSYELWKNSMRSPA